MAEDSIILENLQVGNHGDLMGKVKDTGGEETSAFTELFQRINNHFSNEQMVSTVPHPVLSNELYIGKSSKDKKWHRVRVEHVLSRSQGYHATCFLVDEGSYEMIPLAFLRNIPDVYLTVPFQLKHFYLYGITPITLTISSEDLMTSMQPTTIWDSAAVKFIQRNVELSSSYKAFMMERKSDGKIGIRLYLKIISKQFCLNEELVNKGYATFSSESEEADEEGYIHENIVAKPKRTITEVLKRKKIVPKPPYGSDREDHNYASEPEPRLGTGGSDSEMGYVTDSLNFQRRRRMTQEIQSQHAYHSEIVIEKDQTEKARQSQMKLPTNESLTRPTAVLAKLEASLKASSRQSLDSDTHSQDNFTVHSKHEVMKGSQSSLSRLGISSTTVTSYNQSDSETSDFSSGAQIDVSKFQTVSPISPQAGLRQSMKGYQSDSSHAHFRSNVAHRNIFSPHMCSDTENDRIVSQHDQYEKSLFKSSNQTPSISLQQSNLPQGIRSERDSKTDSPLAKLAKQLSGSSSPVPGGVSPVRGRGNSLSLSNSVSPVKGRGISPSYSDTGSPGRGRGINASYFSPRSPVVAQENRFSFTNSPSMQRTEYEDKQKSHQNQKYSMDTQNALVPPSASVPTESQEYKRNLFSHDANEMAKSQTSKSSSLSVYTRDRDDSNKGLFLSDNESLCSKSKTVNYTSGTETDGNSVLARLVTGQADFKKSRLPREASYLSGTESESSNVMARSVTGQSGFTKSRLPREVDLNVNREMTQSVRQSLEKTEPKPATQVHQKSFPISDTETRVQPERTVKSFDTDSELTIQLKRQTTTKNMVAAEGTDEQKQKLLAKLTGQRMLKNLKENSVKLRASTQETQDKVKSRGMFGVEDNVLVHGSQPKKPIYKFSDARFAEVVAQYWMLRDFPAPQVVQAYSWPAIRQGKHVIAIAPEKTGKTLTYLCPLITSLTHQALYKDVGPGNGPFLVILTSSWRKAEDVFMETMKITGNRRDLRITLLHAGGQEENKASTLINGCEIMVVTPPSLKRMLVARYTNLRRLCHLVIDDAEETMENFGEEVIYTMREYTEVITNQKSNAEAPRQFLVMGSQWTGRIQSFMKNYPVEPLLIITSAYEASIYGKVKHLTHMCVTNERIREVTGLLDNTTDDNRTIIFAAKKEDVIKLYTIIRNYSRYCRMVYQDMEIHEVNEVAEEWRHHKLPLLVCCDEHIVEMKICDANTIINYDLPGSKTRFCNRLACMRKYFWDFSVAEEQKVQPVSHLIISEDCHGSQIYAILQLLKRSSSHIPPQLKALMAGIRQSKEEDDEKELCSQLLAFGFCRNQWKCVCRHIVFPNFDHRPEFDWVPDEGEVKVSITHVIDATHYYVRLLSLKTADFKEDLGTVYSQLQMDIGLWYGNLANLVRHKSPYEGEICGFQDRENFYRVQILHIKDMNCRGAANIDATVKFIDSGRVEDIPAHKLYELPAHLKEIPFQAVEVFVCRVKPIDRDTEWTNKADHFIHNLLNNKVVEGKIVLRLGCILWLDPLVERHSLGETRMVINRAYVHRELIANGFADENPNHLEKLYKLCENKVMIPKALIKKAKIENKLQTDVLPECKQYHSVVVSSVAQPDLFFIQRKEKLDELDELMATIDTLMTSQDPVEDVGVEVKVGDYCLAEYSSYDKRWYRGRITKLEDDTCEVFFADYGDRDTVPRDKVRKIPNDDRLTDFPLQGIECSLADIVPRGSEWSEAVGDVMWDLTHMVNRNDMKTFTAKVKSKEQPDYAGRFKFVIEMYDTSGSEDFNLAQELVYRNLASPADGSSLTELFEKPSKLRMLVVRNPGQNIQDLCASIYWEQDEARALKSAGEIHSKLSAALSSRLIPVDETMILPAVSSVVKLVGRAAWTDVDRLILDTVLVIARASERLSEELLKEGCEDQIIRCLELNSNPKIQCHAVDILGRLVQVSSRMKTCFEDLKNIEVLYDLFDSTDSQQIQGMVCRAFCILCTNSSVFTYLMSKKEDRPSLCPALTKLLSSADHDVIEEVILLLLALSHHNSGHSDLERESLLQAIIETINKSNSEKCIHCCVQYCSNFGAQKRKHKTVLLELEMVPCLSSIIQRDYSSATIKMCKDLMDSLVIRVPSQEMSGVIVRAEQQNTKRYSVVAPEIHWTQNSFNVMLSVKVKGVSNSPDLVKVNEDMVIFRAIVDGMTYGFTYKLFDKVMPEHNRIRVKSSEVLISMKKVEKGKWPRLLHQKQKPSNLSIDFERFVDSSDSEFSNEDEPFMLKRKKKAKLFSGKDAPRRNVGSPELAEDSGTDTSDSLENMDDREKDRFSIFE